MPGREGRGEAVVHEDLVGCALVQAAVGSVRVVVRDVLVEKHTQLALVPDARPVEELVAQGAYPPLGESVRLR